VIKLHHFDRSPFGWKVRVVLAEKNVPYEAVEPKDKMNDPEFARMNPYRKTPVLELGDGRAVYESTVICEYLEEAYPDPAMLPKDPYERARVREIEDTTDQYLYPALRGCTTSQYEYTPPQLTRKATIDEALLATSRTEVGQQLEILEKQLEGRRWFGGDLFSLADAAVMPLLLGGLKLHGFVPDAKYRNLSGWMERATERASYEASKPKVAVTIKA
jgi:glutathione S-transferase